MSFVSDYIFSLVHFILWYYTQSGISIRHPRLTKKTHEQCNKIVFQVIVETCNLYSVRMCC